MDTRRVFKRLSIIMVCITIMVVMIVAGTVTSDAATNTYNSFKEGKIVKSGDYLFSEVYQYDKGKYTIYRTSLSGMNPKVIASSNMGHELYSYDGKIIYNTTKGIYKYKVKSGTKTKIAGSSYKAVGICSKGVIAQKDYYNIYLVKFNGDKKKICSNSDYIAANSKYVFVFKTSEIDYQYKKLSVYRYSLKTGKLTKKGTIKLSCYDSTPEANGHAFKNYIVFTAGVYEGSMQSYSGNAYRMKSNGTEIKKLLSNSLDSITPGKSCVYVGKNNINKPSSDSSKYKITSSGSLKKVNNLKSVYTTSTGYNLYNTSSGSLRTKKIGSSSTKAVLSASKRIMASDPSDAKVDISYVGAVGNKVLVTSEVYTYMYSDSWRPECLRTNVYIVNAKTGNAVRIDK